MTPLLPFRKKGLFSREQICEYAAIPSMAKSVFFIGGELGLADTDAAELALANISGFGDWPTFVLSLPNEMDKALDLSSAEELSFETLYEPVIGHIHAGLLKLNEPPSGAMLLTPEQCAYLLEYWVHPGLLFSVLLPRTTRRLLVDWLAQPTQGRRLGIGGLSVNERPLASSVEQLCEAAGNIFANWVAVAPEMASYAKENLEKAKKNERFVAARLALQERYAET